MAHTVKDMDDKSHPNTILRSLNPPKNIHLKPLSAYSRMATSPTKSPRPFINFKIEIVNDSAKKRKFDESSLNDGSSSPAKKLRSPNAVSPDLGCFTDYSSPLSGRDSMSPFTPSFPGLYEEARRTETKETVHSRLGSEHVGCGGSSVLGDKEEIEQAISNSEMALNFSSTFDHDVDDMLCLNPLSQEERKVETEVKPDLRTVEEDNGYISTSHPNDEQEKCEADRSSEPECHKPTLCGQHFSFLNNDSCTTASGPLLEPLSSPKESLEGDVEEVWEIGEPIFESSICQSSTAVEHMRRLSEALKEHASACQAHSGGDSTVDTSYEDTLPLKVQVKSKVEIPRPSQTSSKPAAQEQNGDRTVRRDNCARSQRPNICNSKTEWEQQKRQYVHSVTSHMTEKQGTTQGLMTELLDLMTHVAGQTDSNGAQWRHPSDLTCRNYQKQFGNETPSMTLDEWRAKNLMSHRRFCKVPKIFERSPFP